MKLTLSVFAVLLLIGCSDSSKQASQQKAAATAPVAAQAVAKTEPVAAPAPIQETVMPPVEVQKTEEPPAPEVAAVPSGEALYERCVACHGSQAEKAALGKSQIIASWDAAKIASALKGYKDGSYGGAMKTLMEGQVKEYSDADIKAVAKYINGLSLQH